MKGGGNSPKFEIIYVEGDATQPILKKLNLTGSHLGGSTRHVNGKKKTHTHHTPLYEREKTQNRISLTLILLHAHTGGMSLFVKFNPFYSPEILTTNSRYTTMAGERLKASTLRRGIYPTDETRECKLRVRRIEGKRKLTEYNA